MKNSYNLTLKANRLFSGIVKENVNDNLFLVSDFTLPDSYNPHNTRLFYIGVQCGFEWLDLAVIWANCEQEALDIACDNDMLDNLLAEDQDYEDESLTAIGNASELFNLESIILQEVDIDKIRDFHLLVKYVQAVEQNADFLSEVV